MKPLTLQAQLISVSSRSLSCDWPVRKLITVEVTGSRIRKLTSLKMFLWGSQFPFSYGVFDFVIYPNLTTLWHPLHISLGGVKAPVVSVAIFKIDFYSLRDGGSGGGGDFIAGFLWEVQYVEP